MHIPEIFTLNVRGLSNDDKRRQLFYYMNNSVGSIFMAQETHSTEQEEQKWKNEWGGEIYFSHGESNARGVCIFIKNDIAFSVSNIVRDQQGRYVIIDLELEGCKFTLANIYGPNIDDPEFFSDMITDVALQNDYIVIGGDFNFVMDVELDKKGGNPKTHDKSARIIKAWCDDSNLIDIWRHQHPDL